MPPRAVCSLILVMFKLAGKALFVANGAGTPSCTK